MATPDMKPYAERLAKAMPERFGFTEGPNGGRWYCGTHDYGIDYASSSDEQWAFWGPLADELGIAAVWRNTGHATTLEAIAEAVCQEAERRGKE